MNPIYTMEYPLRPCDFDRFSGLQPAGIMDLFQDIAGRHALELGIGLPQLSEQNLMWIVSGLQYQIVNTPKMYDRVKITTWPLPASSVTCRREYKMEALDGTLLVVGTSDWAIMDGVKRKLVRAKEVYPQGLDYCTHLAIEGKMPRLRDFPTTREGMTLTPGFSQLDCNGHVNNTKYANYVLDAAELQEGQSIREFQIRYSKELMPHQPVTLFTSREGNTVYVMGKNEQNETMFHGRIEL